jgi:hypothetical protein
MIFEVLFMWAQCPAKIWQIIQTIALSLGLCSFDSKYVELGMAAAFTLTVMFIELLFFTPFAYIDTFLVRKEHGYSKATIKSFLQARFMAMY